jgi:hypothetical protein
VSSTPLGSLPPSRVKRSGSFRYLSRQQRVSVYVGVCVYVSVCWAYMTISCRSFFASSIPTTSSKVLSECSAWWMLLLVIPADIGGTAPARRENKAKVRRAFCCIREGGREVV